MRIFLLITSFWLFQEALLAKPKTIVASASPAQLALLKKVDKKYQKNHGIHLILEKHVTLAMLGTQRLSEGEIWLNQGKMRLEIHKPEKSKIVAGEKFLWIENGAPADFKDAKTQVLKASLTSDRAKSQGLIQLLTQGGVLNYFKVSGVQSQAGEVIFFLQPKKQAVEFKRAQIRVRISQQEIVELRYWDQVDNEISYVFTRSQFNLKVDPKKFAYKPPKNAEVIIY